LQVSSAANFIFLTHHCVAALLGMLTPVFLLAKRNMIAKATIEQRRFRKLLYYKSNRIFRKFVSFTSCTCHSRVEPGLTYPHRLTRLPAGLRPPPRCLSFSWTAPTGLRPPSCCLSITWAAPTGLTPLPRSLAFNRTVPAEYQ
jgi:hypothetical protein